MIKKIKEAAVIGLVAGVVVLGLQFVVSQIRNQDSVGLGAAGGLLAENYIPYVMANNGYNSAKDINTSGTLSSANFLAFGSSTVAGNLTVTDALAVTGTSTSATSTVSGPLRLKALAPSCIEVFATSTQTVGRLTFTASSTVQTGAIVGFVTYSYGACTP